jgi:hypothetical protein
MAVLNNVTSNGISVGMWRVCDYFMGHRRNVLVTFRFWCAVFFKMEIAKAMISLRQLFAGFQSLQTRFDPRSVMWALWWTGFL